MDFENNLDAWRQADVPDHGDGRPPTDAPT
jgi:hypothetical protein